MAFATVGDLEARWHELDEGEEARASVLLDDASSMLASLVDVDSDDEQQAALLRSVCCSMVIRAMVASASDAYGISQMSATMGPFGQTVHYQNPSGDLYLTGQEKDMLGVGTGGYIIDLRARIGVADD